MRHFALLLFLMMTVGVQADIVVQGSNTDIDAATDEDVFTTGTWAKFTTAQQAVFTAGGSDDSDGVLANDNGADSLLVYGLNALYKAIQNKVGTDGTDSSGCVTDSNFIAINRVEVFATGSLGYNKAEIIGYARTDQTAQISIPAEHNASGAAIYTVPAGRGMRLVDWWAALGQGVITGAVDARIVYQDSSFSDTAWRTIDVINVVGTGSSHVPHTLNVRIPPRAAIKVRANVSTNNSDVFAGFRLAP